MQRFRAAVGALVVVVVVGGTGFVAKGGRIATPVRSTGHRAGGCPPAVALAGVKVSFRGLGGARLRGELFGTGPNGAVIVGASASTFCDTVRRNATLLADLAASGVQTLVVERRLALTSTAVALSDVRAAAATLRGHGARTIALIGEAGGGVLALSAGPSAGAGLTAIVNLSGRDQSKRDAGDASRLLPLARRAVGSLKTPLLMIAARGNPTAVSSARMLLDAAAGLDNQLAIVPGAATSSLLDPRRGPAAAALARRIVDFVAHSAKLPTSGTRGTAVARLGSSLRNGTGYDRYSYLVVGAGDAAAAGRLRAKSFVYVSGTSVQPRFFTGVSVDEARRHDWLLRDASGAYVMNVNYGAYIGDFGNPEYQRQWTDNVIRILRANHDDGVFIDDVIADAPSLTGGVYPTKYPNQAAWEGAQVAFVKAVGRTLQASGFYVVAEAVGYVAGDPRSNNAELTARFWRRLAPGVDGLWSEYWLELPTNVKALRTDGTDDWTQFWSGWQGLVDVAQNAGVDFFAEMYGSGTDTTGMRYGKASFLLDWDGRGGGFAYTPDGGATDPWNSEWTMDIGRPLGPKYRVGVGWRRDYTDGTTLVNPSSTTSQSYALGSTYVLPDGTAVAAVTLAPTTGLTLRRPKS